MTAGSARIGAAGRGSHPTHTHRKCPDHTSPREVHRHTLIDPGSPSPHHLSGSPMACLQHIPAQLGPSSALLIPPPKGEKRKTSAILSPTTYLTPPQSAPTIPGSQAAESSPPSSLCPRGRSAQPACSRHTEEERGKRREGGRGESDRREERERTAHTWGGYTAPPPPLYT